MNVHRKILKTVEDQLDILEIEEEDFIVLSEKGIKIASRALKEIRQVTIENGFKSDRNEILFFKEIKPRLCSKIIYYAKLFNIESRRPRGSNQSQMRYLNQQIEKLQAFFSENLEFYHYYRRNGTSLDQQFFTRGNTDIRFYLDNFYGFADEEFSTSHDCTVATIIAYDMLIVHLNTEISKLEHYGGRTGIPTLNRHKKLFWTASKVNLIELIYALHSSSAINHGAINIKVLTALFERLFNINLGNFYHTYIEIRARKTSRTKFLDFLKSGLIRRMDDADE